MDKDKIKEELTLDNIFELLQEWGGEPEYTNFGILSSTICHNLPGDGSRKLYYYSNSNLFHCYTSCAEPSFDIFELTIKVAEIQSHMVWNLYNAMLYICQRFGLDTGNPVEQDKTLLDDWTYLENYDRIKELSKKQSNIVLKNYDMTILEKFNYSAKIVPWLQEGIDQQVMDIAFIGFYPSADSITIPHFDINNRLVGIRGRALSDEEIERFGKYRPLKVNGIQYNHPLGMNLYGLNWAKNGIHLMEKAIVFESEKSVLKYIGYFGKENNIAVACCGSNISMFQIDSLIRQGAKEIIIAFDRQFQEIGDREFKHLTKTLTKLSQKYKQYVNISCIFDKNRITTYKNSPIDEGKDKFLQLYKERIYV